MSFTRRTILATAATLPFAGAFAADTPETTIAALESRSGGRLGVSALDTRNGRRILHRADERFPMCSTFKILLAALVLQKVDQRLETLARRIAYDASLFPSGDFYAPVARAHLNDGGMTVEALCAAAVEYSDNGAANLLLDTVGSPSAVAAFARSIGDPVTRLDRRELELNVFTPSDPRDTTTPLAMMNDLNRLLLGDKVLSPASRQRLTGWMLDCKTADARIPAGLLKGWRSANKTGSYPEQGSANDIAIIWPPGRKPILLAVYFTGSKLTGSDCDKVIADVARVVSGTFH
jgi:beta-lactamase class A